MDKSNLENLRHSAAHLLAAAVIDLWPSTKHAIGPAIEHGFYFDFDLPEPIAENDFPKIEQKMRELVKEWKHFERKELTIKEAEELFKNNPYKLELIEEFSKNGQTLTVFQSGDYKDLCRGGHCENPRDDLKHFKLLSIAGAYWRGSEKNKMLTRIYGTVFATKEEIESYLHQLEEAKKRDHKKLGKELDLFLFSDLVGPGLPIWTPKGTVLREQLDNFVWKLRKKAGYQRVTVPHITKKDLYEKSGHWSKFEKELFNIKTREGHLFAMKPMNCPHHIQIFSHTLRSYHDMPIRFTETTMCYRDEQTGELSGLSRVRSFTQDDAHVFCMFNQIKQEFVTVWDIVDQFYSTFGFDMRVRLSFHDPEKMENYLGEEKAWKAAESVIKTIADERKPAYEVFTGIGEAAFYGPKIDFMAKDSIGREWQVATIQLDMNMPERFDLTYINAEGEKERVYMIHAAIMGSIERFLSILIEHYAGVFPLWLSPTQVNVLPVSDKHNDIAQIVAKKLVEEDIRVELNKDNKTLGAKIRESTLQKVPYMIIIGDKESQTSVSVRTREGKDLGKINLSEFINNLKGQIEKYA